MYVTLEYFINDYGGQETEYTERLLERASTQIDRMTFGRIRKRGFDNLSDYQKNLVKKAVCSQAEFLRLYGDHLSSPFTNYSIGDVSLGFDRSAVATLNGVQAGRDVLDYLIPTGLTVRIL